MEELGEIIKKAVVNSGATEADMLIKGYRVITPDEYLSSLQKKDSSIALWIRDDDDSDDVATTVAFAYPKIGNNSSAPPLTHAEYDLGDETDSATTMSTASTVLWKLPSDLNAMPKEVKTQEAHSIIIANEGITNSNQAMSLWGDLKM